MSLETALDEERKEVMALLEGNTAPRQPRSASSSALRSQSPASSQPKSPIRSMLDVSDAPRTYKSSRSMLDISEVPPSSKPRSMLDIGESLPGGKPRHASVAGIVNSRAPGLSPARKPASPPSTVRSTSGAPGPKPERREKPPAMASINILGTLSALEGKQSPTTGGSRHRKSSSPASRSTGPRSRSPVVNPSAFNSNNDPKKFVSPSGKVINMDHAYRRLSDAAMLRSGGSLSGIAPRKSSDSSKTGDSDINSALHKDDYDEEGAPYSSDDNDTEGSSGPETWGSEKRRGRRRHRAGNEANSDDPEGPKSLLAAAEDERKELSSNYTYRSLLEPTVTVTGPDGEKMASKKSGVHPNTNFDQGGSGVSTPMDSDVEAEISEIRRAQRMAMNISPIHSTPEAHRCVRQVVRGEYVKFQLEAEQGLRRQRVYLVATDLSEEAAYALEWTIGTVLRDGDTLLAVYAVDEETGTGMDTTSRENGSSVTAAEEATSLAKTLSHDPSGGISPINNKFSSTEFDRPPDLANMEKAERERWTAAMEVSDRCIKLLRKTKLQVRVVVEVFHCKSPKHMITEVIDFLEPTLVILGSRGRSALKGVLLGSFSNYLVTKSSVPVMVARKRLRKHSKYKRTNLRLSNVLSNPRKLETAKID